MKRPHVIKGKPRLRDGGILLAISVSSEAQARLGIMPALEQGMSPGEGC